MESYTENWRPEWRIFWVIGGVAVVALFIIGAVVLQSCTRGSDKPGPQRLLDQATNVGPTNTPDPFVTPYVEPTLLPNQNIAQQPTAIGNLGSINAQGGAYPLATQVPAGVFGGGVTPIPTYQTWPTNQPVYPSPTPIPYWQQPQPTQQFVPGTNMTRTWCTFDTVAVLPSQTGWGGYQVQGPFKGACRPQNTVITGVAVVVDGVTVLQNDTQWDPFTGGSVTPWLTTAGITQWGVQDRYNSRCIQWRYDQITPQNRVEIVVFHSLGQDTYPIAIEHGQRWTAFGSSICAYSPDLQRLRGYYGETPLHWLVALGYRYHQEMVDQILQNNGVQHWLSTPGQELVVPAGWVPNRWINPSSAAG